MEKRIQVWSAPEIYCRRRPSYDYSRHGKGNYESNELLLITYQHSPSHQLLIDEAIIEWTEADDEKINKTNALYSVVSVGNHCDLIRNIGTQPWCFLHYFYLPPGIENSAGVIGFGQCRHTLNNKISYQVEKPAKESYEWLLLGIAPNLFIQSDLVRRHY